MAQSKHALGTALCQLAVANITLVNTYAQQPLAPGLIEREPPARRCSF